MDNCSTEMAISSGKLEMFNKPTVLIVAIDKKILESYSCLFDPEKFQVLLAYDADEAMEQIRGKKISLLLTEFMLGTKSSVELFTLVKKSNPGVPVVVMTEYPELISERDIRMFGGDHLLSKPLVTSNLHRIITGYFNPLHEVM